MPKNGLQFTQVSLKNFWGRTWQPKVFADFWNGRYQAAFGLTREKYRNKYFSLQQLNNPIDEEVTVSIVLSSSFFRHT